jgi:two-component system CheB/CheR fusion protein
MPKNGVATIDSTDSKPSVAFPTVGIGASAGGLKVLQAFFGHIPADLGAAYVVIVHLDPEYQSELAAILGQRTSMPVVQVQDRIPLEPNSVYVIPPNRRLLISDHTIGTFPFEEPRGRRAPIDQFFRSLADQHGDGFAVILSGAGSDGSLGVKAIKEGGGLILVQDPEEAEYPSMPRSAIATGIADVVAPVAGIAAQISELIRTKQHLPKPDLVDDDEDALRRILAHLRGRTGHDFSLYKRATVLRRLGRRMQISRVDKLEDYYTLLRGNAEEAQSLFADLLISVTTFFRDNHAFDALAKDVIKPLFDSPHRDHPIRVWVAGCATGEEAYSIAMLLSEEASRREDHRPLQIFASDLDHAALATARNGRYPSSIETDVSEERLKSFFSKEGDHYRIKREIRDLVLFTSHSILKDPPFSKVDLISCRNLLIYLDKQLQQQVCTTFHYALMPGKYLFLGSSENADVPAGLFRPVNRDAHIFQSASLDLQAQELLPRLAFSPRLFSAQEIPMPLHGSAERAAVLHHRALEEMAPPTILVDRAYRVVHLSETAGRFLQPSFGQLSLDITELVRAELRFDLRSCLHNALEKGSSELSLPIPVAFGAERKRVYIQVWPVHSVGDQPEQALIAFFEGSPVPLGQATTDGVETERTASDQLLSLQEELELTRARLRSSREESDSANEELRAANEELQSINEEYRSTAEELETSKEELQSINEELQTVNQELKIKLESVSRANNDLQNLMAATDVGTLFLDTSLSIKRFTPPLAALFNITSNDEGRPITDFTHRLEYAEFAHDARTVLRELSPIEREIKSGDSWFLTRLRPYRTADDRIDGIVVTFIDITERLATEESLKTSEARSRLLLQELSHRVKNTLAVVQAMARLSFKQGTDLKKALPAFSGRLAALSQAHELLVHNDWSGAQLADLIHRQLGPHAQGSEEIVKIEGPKVLLPAGLATPFALILHELATNATKYGVFSRSGGNLSLTWTLSNDRQLGFVWCESGLPRSGEPHSSGFGTYLIQHGLPGADVKRVFTEEGLICTINVRLSTV